jgi:hypothetical protein
MHTVTLNINNNSYNNLIKFISNSNDIKIIKDEVIEPLDIEVVTEDDPDYQIILRGRKERITHPENYLSEDEINWN